MAALPESSRSCKKMNSGVKDKESAKWSTISRMEQNNKTGGIRKRKVTEPRQETHQIIRNGNLERV